MSSEFLNSKLITHNSKLLTRHSPGCHVRSLNSVRAEASAAARTTFHGSRLGFATRQDRRECAAPADHALHHDTATVRLRNALRDRQP
jgi:hypothetical protein